MDDETLVPRKLFVVLDTETRTPSVVKTFTLLREARAHRDFMRNDGIPCDVETYVAESHLKHLGWKV